MRWQTVSTRIVTARLKVVSREQRRPGGSREIRNLYISVIFFDGTSVLSGIAIPGPARAHAWANFSKITEYSKSIY